MTQKILLDSSVFIDGVNSNAENHETSRQLLEWAVNKKKIFSMPAHAWFEIWCTLKRLEKVDKTFKGCPINGNWQYPIEMFYIDENFLKKYANTELRYIKSGDHIFLALAKVNNYPIVTNDNKMRDVAEGEGIKVYNPKQFIDSLDSR